MSCGDDETAETPAAYKASGKSLTVVCSIGGLGDNGYNDNIMEGLMDFYNTHDVVLHIAHPESIDDALSVYESWLLSSADSSLLVFAGSEYQDIPDASDNLGGKKVLIMESTRSDLPEGASVAKIQRYGASWLSGLMVAKGRTVVVKAMDGDEMVDDAAKGFIDGYSAYSDYTPYTIVLSDNYDGFSMPNQAYSAISDLYSKELDDLEDSSYSFSTIFPLAGGSNIGLQRFSFAMNRLCGIIGMDRDISSLSDWTPFSVVIRSGDLLRDLVTLWHEGSDIPSSVVYGLDSKYIDIVTNPTTSVFFGTWDDDLFPRLKSEYFDEAVRKEAEYEK
ncbi:MAG: hypothetical protein ACI4B3_04530 [Prevotella sp.]